MEILKKYECLVWIIGILLLLKLTSYKKYMACIQSKKERDKVCFQSSLLISPPQKNMIIFSEKVKNYLQKTDSSLCTTAIQNNDLTINIVCANPIEIFTTIEDLLTQYSLEINSIHLKASGQMACLTFTCSQKKSS